MPKFGGAQLILKGRTALGSNDHPIKTNQKNILGLSHTRIKILLIFFLSEVGPRNRYLLTMHYTVGSQMILRLVIDGSNVSAVPLTDNSTESYYN